ncbi:hypothetical protein EJB05_47837, partial [Eragrostis curvula]
TAKGEPNKRNVLVHHILAVHKKYGLGRSDATAPTHEYSRGPRPSDHPRRFRSPFAEPPPASATETGAGFGNLSKCSESSSIELDTRVTSVLSQVVVSLASFVGDTMHYRCAGIFVQGSYANDTFVLTSADLVRSSIDENEVIDNLTIKVRLPDNQVVIGLLHHYNVKYGTAIVNIEHVDGFRAANISPRPRKRESSSQVVAVGRCFDSGMLKTASGIMTGGLTDEPSEFCSPHAKSPWIGGPLVGLDGYFAGINCRGGKMAAFLPRNKIIECLGPFGILRVDFNQRGDGTRKGRTLDDVLLDDLCEFSRCNGYPLPTEICEEVHEMHVINSFETEFDGDIWSTLSKDIDSTMSDCVVSLASFNGDARLFACTGIFINCYPARILTSASLVRKSDDENNIDDNLWIQVSLRNKRRVRGTLKHYNLRYNVAVIDIMGFCSPCAIELEKHISVAPNTEVIALGCRFNERKLMATKGVLNDKQSKLDCKELKISTCKITKSGIGGPLIDGHGSFVGMNFYDDEETPYLPREIIQKVLKSFDAKGHTAAENTTDVAPNRWPVPKPEWYYPCLADVVPKTYEEVDGVLQLIEDGF